MENKRKKIRAVISNGIKIPEVLFFVISIVWLGVVTSRFMKYHRINPDVSYLFKLEGQFNLTNFLHLLVEYISALFLVVGIIAGAFFIGRRVIQLLKIKMSSPLEDLTFSFGAGLGSLGYIVFFLGIFGLLYKSIFYPLWLVLFVLGIKEILPLAKTGASKKFQISLLHKIIIFLLFLLVLFNFLISFTPEMFYDSLNYHLGLPNYYSNYHRILPSPYKIVSHYPHLMSIVYLMGMMLKNEMTPKLINFSCGLITILGIFYFCEKNFNSRIMGIIGAAVFYFTPTVISRSWSATTDIGLTLFTFLSLSALINSLTIKGDNKWLILSAILAGFAMGSKYSGILFSSGLAAVLFFSKDSCFFTKIKKILLFGAIALMTYSPWLVKNYVESGNPVHPFLAKYWNVKYSHQSHTDQIKNYFSAPVRKKQNFLNLLTVPWNLSIKGGGSNKYSSPDYFMIGAVFLAFIPLFFLIDAKNKKTVYKLLLFSFFTYVLWVLWAPDTKIKYYTPAIPALSVAAAFAVVKTGEINKFIGNILLWVFIFLITINFLFMVPLAHVVYKPFSILTGSLSKSEYLSASRPSYPCPSYGAYRYANKNLSADAKILMFRDSKCYYIKRKFVTSDVAGHNPLIEFLNHVSDADEFYSYLKQKEITHIIVNIPETIRTAVYGTLYFEKKNFAVLNEFWKKYMKKLYDLNGVYLYEILSEKEASKPHSPPPNTVQETYLTFMLQSSSGKIQSGDWKGALEDTSDLIDKNVADHRTYYFAGVCYYNLGDYVKAEKNMQIAYKLRPEQRYRQLLEELKKKL
ncbi:MAG: glycosyltransferase family 39 protein [bacterium]